MNAKVEGHRGRQGCQRLMRRRSITPPGIREKKWRAARGAGGFNGQSDSPL